LPGVLLAGGSIFIIVDIARGTFCLACGRWSLEGFVPSGVAWLAFMTPNSGGGEQPMEGLAGAGEPSILCHGRFDHDAPAEGVRDTTWACAAASLSSQPL
jgi:hypothetical protein